MCTSKIIFNIISEIKDDNGKAPTVNRLLLKS